MDEGRTERVNLSVPSDLRYGEAVRAMLGALASRLEEETETAELRAHVISAFGEAFNNIVEHAHHAKRSELIEIEVSLSTTSLSISLSDRGAGFEIDAVETPALETMPESGLGLLIIRSVMSRVDYQRLRDRNVLTMIKEFARPLPLEEKTGPEA